MSFPSTVAWPPPPPSQPHPAYNAVPARTTLAKPTPVAAPPAPEKPRKVEWSEPVRNYVRRAFEPQNEIKGISTEEMQVKLKSIISYYAERQMHDQIDWSTYPLPQQLLLQERREATAGLANPVYTSVNVSSYPTNMPSPALTLPSSKRKSQDAEELETAAAKIPPWQKTNLQDRVTFGDGQQSKRQKKTDITKDIVSKFDQADLEKRKQRFNTGKSGTAVNPPWRQSRKDEDEVSMVPIVGTNMSLEKSYFRLTAPPKPETVRPQHVLEKTLDMLRKKWKSEKNYNYICNQFKSLRQDLTVQHIKNSFTVRVYETHARIALEKGDLGEYNQCQTQLKGLYAQGLGGHPGEFLAYRILYFVYTCNKTDMNDLLAELTIADKSKAEVKHALDVRSSLAVGNYHKFFRLYLDAPNMGAYLMDMFIERERLHALANISRGYISVPLRFVTDELGFENDKECEQFLQEHSAHHLVEEKRSDQTVQMRVRVKEGATLFEQLRAAAFSRVDIKGQI
ncbi:uncharacterized protein EI97DRAFT_474943 [Westerdykella ornata]|uniref:PCI domain-containing protein n=1 Tax=Westerdykella ornata TaxID=318751 RepID=A0A6A6JIY1_WESOR|nr:uncharacterized protein EI97DRAFT_474943 [Westerdykella ornata]KAF2275616.1 hypothetical protein EI97DRAFT_474943 [Westerdykella ornata]